MGTYIFNENGHLSFIDDIIRYLSIQIDKEDVIKIYITNLYWDKYNRIVDLSIKQGYYKGDLYQTGKTATDAINIIGEYLETVFNATKLEIIGYQNRSEEMIKKEIEGYNEIKNDI